MEADTIRQARAIFIMPLHPREVEITIRAAKAAGLNAEKASRFHTLIWISSPSSLFTISTRCP
jgi:hypothetical protein